MSRTGERQALSHPAVGQSQRGHGTERWMCLLAWFAVGYAALVPNAATATASWSAVDAVLRTVLIAVLSMVLLLGPGFALRHRRGAFQGPSVAFLPLPGLMTLALIGALLWLIGPLQHPQVVTIGLVSPILVVLTAVAWSPRRDAPLTHGERQLLRICAALLLVVLGKGLWALGPVGELYGGMVGRTLEVGDRPDSAIPYYGVQLVVNGLSPYSVEGSANYFPYTFSHRGPVPGLAASAPVVLSGAEVRTDLPFQPWAPFDPEGFAAYRIFMATAALSALFAVFGFLRLVLHERAAVFGALLASLTPFVVHELYFTWPKLLAASLIISAAVLAGQLRFFWCGWLVGLAYLCHPSSLLAVPGLVLWMLLVLWRDSPGRLQPRWLVRAAAGLVLPGTVTLIVWRAVNGPNFAQSSFLRIFFEADTQLAATWADWLGSRSVSIGNTLIPLYLPLAHGDYHSINMVGGISPPVVHFFFQYWCSLPFGVSIVFFPLLVAALMRTARRRPTLFVAFAVTPFLIFAVYWGSAMSGMLREGLHAWVLILIVLYAWQRYALPQPGPSQAVERFVLPLRGVEVLAMLMVPTVVTQSSILSGTHRITDAVAVAFMLAGVTYLSLATHVFLGEDHRRRDALGPADGNEHDHWRPRGGDGVVEQRAGFASLSDRRVRAASRRDRREPTARRAPLPLGWRSMVIDRERQPRRPYAHREVTP